jgi:hypothetical protein
MKHQARQNDQMGQLVNCNLFQVKISILIVQNYAAKSQIDPFLKIMFILSTTFQLNSGQPIFFKGGIVRSGTEWADSGSTDRS